MMSIHFDKHSQMCNDAPAYSIGPDFFATCGIICDSKLQAATDPFNPNHPRTTHPDSPQPTPTDNSNSLTPANNPLRSSTSSAPSGMCFVSS